MDQMENKPQPSQKPLAAFVVILFVALFVGGWLYINSVKTELGAKIDSVSSRVEATEYAPEDDTDDAGERTMPPTDGWQTLGDMLGSHTFQIDVPDTHTLMIIKAAETDPTAYVILKPTAENETPTPDMVIGLVDVRDPRYADKAGKQDDGTWLIPAAGSKEAFRITGWEDQAWPDFARAAASFRTP